MKSILLALVLTACGGCASSIPAPDLDPTVINITKYVSYECGEVPALTPVELVDVHWILFKLGENVLWTLTAQQYTNLGENTSTILLGVKELKGQRDFWKTCIDASIERTMMVGPE